MARQVLDPRHEVVLREDLITPMHHHVPGQDYLLAKDGGGQRRVSVQEASRLVAAANSTPGVHEVDHVHGRGFSRRSFLKAGTIGAGAMAVTSIHPRMAFAAGARDLLVVVFLRGALDGLSAVVPVTDSAYYNARPQVAVRPENTFALSSSFGMNNNFSAMKHLWDARQVAIVLGAGGPNVTRSHFEDQNSCEQAAPASMRSGWIGRQLASSSSESGTFRAISMGNQVALSMTTTAFDTVAMSSVDEFNIYAWSGMEKTVTSGVERLFSSAGGTAQEEALLTLRAINELAAIRNAPYTPENGAVYPDTSFGRGLRDIARMSKGEVGLEAATIDFVDWDMHNAMGLATNPNDWFSRQSRELASSLSAFAKDMGSRWGTTTVVLMSEFGRRVAQNGSMGTDHGHGNTLWVLGGGINGGLYGSQPSLAPGNLHMGDVPITTDYRLALAEVVSKRLANGGNLSTVFPGYTPGAMLGLAKQR